MPEATTGRRQWKRWDFFRLAFWLAFLLGCILSAAHSIAYGVGAAVATFIVLSVPAGIAEVARANRQAKAPSDPVPPGLHTETNLPEDRVRP